MRLPTEKAPYLNLYVPLAGVVSVLTAAAASGAWWAAVPCAAGEALLLWALSYLWRGDGVLPGEGKK